MKFLLKVLYKINWQVRYCFLCPRTARIDKNLYVYACWDFKRWAFLGRIWPWHIAKLVGTLDVAG